MAQTHLRVDESVRDAIHFQKDDDESVNDYLHRTLDVTEDAATAGKLVRMTNKGDPLGEAASALAGGEE